MDTSRVVEKTCAHIYNGARDISHYAEKLSRYNFTFGLIHIDINKASSVDENG